MMKELNIRVCDENDKSTMVKFNVDEKDEDLVIESLSYDLAEIGGYIDDVFY